jgi:putative transposase
MSLMAVYPKPRLSQSREQVVRYPYVLRGLTIERNNHVWSTDIAYIRLKGGALHRVAIIDRFSRYVLAWQTLITLEAAFCLEALDQAFRIAQPEIFNNDQGSQFTSNECVKRLKAAGMEEEERWTHFLLRGSGGVYNTKRYISKVIRREEMRKKG